MFPVEVYEKILHWGLSGKVGVSSQTIVATILKAPMSEDFDMGYPYDPSDFNRCEKLLQAVPELRSHMDKVASLNPIWKELIDRWDEIAKSLESEVGPDWSKNAKAKAPKTYALMKEIVERTE